MTADMDFLSQLSGMWRGRKEGEGEQREGTSKVGEHKVGGLILKFSDKIILFGGGCNDHDDRWNELCILDTSMQRVRCHVCCVVWWDVVCVVGNALIISEIMQWTISTATPNNTAPHPRQHHTLSTFHTNNSNNSTLYLFGGEGSGKENFVEFNDVMIYDTGTNTPHTTHISLTQMHASGKTCQHVVLFQSLA